MTLKTSALAKIPVTSLFKAKSQRTTGFQRPMVILEENISALVKMNRERSHHYFLDELYKTISSYRIPLYIPQFL